MGHFLQTLELKTYDRLAADTAAGGLVPATSPLLAVHPNGSTAGIGIYNTTPPPVTTPGVSMLPMVVFAFGPVANDDALRTKARRCTLTLDIFVDRNPQAGYNAVQRGSDILARLEGDWEEQVAGTAPTYGLERFKPDISAATGWLADIFEFESFDTAHDEQTFHWVYALTIMASRVGA